jgi:alpha-1,3-rhamnosyl/mannosyltransferase
MPYWPRVPAVVTCYDLIPLLYPGSFRPAQRAVYAAAHRLALARARGVLAISETTKADLVRVFGVAPERVHVTPLAADPGFRPLPPELPARLRAARGLPERFALYVGSNKPHKNLVGLVRAYARARAGGGAATESALVVAGPWDERYPEAKHAAEREGVAGHVLFLGPVPEADLPALYGAATLFAFPSEYEGFGLPVLEAMASGTPVVCARAGALPEIAGDAAFYVEPRDVSDIAAGLQRILQDAELRHTLRARGLDRARAFDPRATTARLADLLEGLAAGPGGR